MSSTPQLIRSGLWQWLQSPGLERFQLLTSPDHWILRGTILTLAEHSTAEAHYEIVCDSGWHTRSAEISLNDGYGERRLRIRTFDGRWYANEQLSQAVSGCVDIDLGWSPSTNTLPIRRLRLDVGQSSGTLVAGWVRFPDLTLEPLPQEYLRIGDRHYRYSSRGGAFGANLTVDDEALALEYEGFWRRVGHH